MKAVGLDQEILKYYVFGFGDIFSYYVGFFLDNKIMCECCKCIGFFISQR